MLICELFFWLVFGVFCAVLDAFFSVKVHAELKKFAFFDTMTPELRSLEPQHNREKCLECLS